MKAMVLKVYEIFKENWGEEKASTVLNYLESTTSEKISAEIKSKIERLATKGDLLKSESSLREELLKSESSLREELLKSESSLRAEMQKLHSSTIKWMFLFWVGSTGTTIAIVLAVIKYIAN